MELVNCSRIAPSSVIPICENPSMGSHPQSVGTLVCSSTSDFISNLPDDVTLNILLRLALLDAARTSVLSKTWRHKWRYLPHLVFDHDFYDSEFICQILLLHRVPITKFELHKNFRNHCVDLRFIMIYLCGNPIQELAFRGFTGLLPSCVFSFEQLQHLNLSGFFIEPTPTFGGFCRLSSLTVDHVSFDCNLYDSLLSKCPLLEHLTIKRSIVDCIVFDFTNLKSFHFLGRLCMFSFKCAPMLETVFIKKIRRTPTRPSNFLDFFKCLPALKDLCLSHVVLELSDSLTLLERLPIVNSHLIVLKIHDVSFRIAKDVLWVLRLISISPNLQKLEIKASDGYEISVEDPRALQQLFDAEFLLNVSLEHLCNVSIFRFRGTVVEFELVKFILTKSVVLEKLHIHSAGRAKDVESLGILSVVTEFPRVSLKAEIMYTDYYLSTDEDEDEDDYDYEYEDYDYRYAYSNYEDEDEDHGYEYGYGYYNYGDDFPCV